jgi:hypothetical protein
MVKPPWGCCSFIKFQKSAMNHFYSYLGEPPQKKYCKAVFFLRHRAVRSSPALRLRRIGGASASSHHGATSLSRGCSLRSLPLVAFKKLYLKKPKKTYKVFKDLIGLKYSYT